MEEPFTLVERSSGGERGYHLFDQVVRCNSAKSADHDLVYVKALRTHFPEMIVTACPSPPLLYFAAAGFASFEVDKDTDDHAGWRGYVPPAAREESGAVGESIDFAKYHYKWNNEDFILFLVGRVQYILKEPREGEHRLGPSRITDELIKTAGDWIYGQKDVVWVYDNYWFQSHELWKAVQEASWDKVILAESMKKELVSVANRFFDSEPIYRDLEVPWKRGVIFYGPPGNGKTISIKALMHSLNKREKPIPTLYVRYAPYTWDIGQVFSKARALAPCMLVLEDVETIVTPETRSYFFNEMDGLENNDGLFIVGSTNFLDKLDPGLSKRPSRFDRKYLFPLPNEHERTLYCEFWRQKLRSNDKIVFPEKLCPAMSRITVGFSFAFLQECFVGTLLTIANEGKAPAETRPYDSDNDDLDDYELWRVFKEQADILRKEVENQKSKQSMLLEWCKSGEAAPDMDDAPVRRSQPATRECQCCRSKQTTECRAPVSKPMDRKITTSDQLLPRIRGKYEDFNSFIWEMK